MNIFSVFRTFNHILVGSLEGIKEIFDELKGTVLPVFRSCRILAESFEKEVKGDLGKKPKAAPKAKAKDKAKPKAKAKKKAA